MQERRTDKIFSFRFKILNALSALAAVPSVIAEHVKNAWYYLASCYYDFKYRNREFSPEMIEAIEEGFRIAHDPSVKAYNSIEELNRALDEEDDDDDVVTAASR